MENITAKPENEAKQPINSGKLNEPGIEAIFLKKSSKIASNPAGVIPSVRDLEAKVAHMASKPGLRSKIDANCLWCSYDPLDLGAWRQQVERCEVTICPLYGVRPRSSSKSCER